MLTLACSNPAKFAPFQADLERWRIALAPPSPSLPEIQTLDFTASLAAKARAAAASFGQPVLVDDAGLVLEAWRPFPGPLTASTIQALGAAGLKQLLREVSDRAVMECHLGCWLGTELRQWSGAVRGRVDCSREVRNPRMPLADWFVPESGAAGEFPHRAAALAALESDLFGLHLELAADPAVATGPCPAPAPLPCPFCAELADSRHSLFAEMMGGRLTSRVVYEDEHFVIMPPLGQFIEGGLLLLTRAHIPSFAHLPPEQFVRLEQLLARIREIMVARWGVAPLVFEHGPAPERGKGVCCVDHAHLNLFPAAVEVHPHLAKRMHLKLGALPELTRLRRAEFGYLFVQENDGTRRAYDGEHVPTQLVRRFITASLGMPERWHWRDYPGQDELAATFQALKARIVL